MVSSKTATVSVTTTDKRPKSPRRAADEAGRCAVDLSATDTDVDSSYDSTMVSFEAELAMHASPRADEKADDVDTPWE